MRTITNDIQLILCDYQQGRTFKELAQKWHYSPSYISRMIRNHPSYKPYRENIDDVIDHIAKDYIDGHTYDELAVKYKFTSRWIKHKLKDNDYFNQNKHNRKSRNRKKND
jgi:Mor family transcriptional regulator